MNKCKSMYPEYLWAENYKKMYNFQRNLILKKDKKGK